jgi:hypothetical protein
MSQYYQDGKERASRRGAGMVLFQPPATELRFDRWHVVETHEGVKTLQWKPGISIWRDQDGLRWTAESAGARGWKYVGPAAGTVA